MINAFLSKYKTSQLVAVSALLVSLSFSTHAYQADMSEPLVQAPSTSAASAVTTPNIVSAKKVALDGLSNPRSFVILQYHHVSTETPRSTSVSPQELEQHMAYLAEYHTVISLEAAINGLTSKIPFPARAVVITFDDGYKNIFLYFHPILTLYFFFFSLFFLSSPFFLFFSFSHFLKKQKPVNAPPWQMKAISPLPKVCF